MIRFLFACVFYSVVAKFGYQEVTMLFPQVAPIIDESFQRIEIPTHDQWSKDGIHQALDGLGVYVDRLATALNTASDRLSERPSR